MRAVLFIFVSTLGFFSSVSYGQNVVNRISCTESSSGLHIVGVVTESSTEPWRFFMALENAAGPSGTFEARSASGFDYGTKESIYGYYHRAKNEHIYYEEFSKPGLIRRTMEVKKLALAGDNTAHTLLCEEVP